MSKVNICILDKITTAVKQLLSASDPWYIMSICPIISEVNLAHLIKELSSVMLPCFPLELINMLER